MLDPMVYGALSIRQYPLGLEYFFHDKDDFIRSIRVNLRPSCIIKTGVVLFEESNTIRIFLKRFFKFLKKTRRRIESLMVSIVS